MNGKTGALRAPPTGRHSHRGNITKWTAEALEAIGLTAEGLMGAAAQ